MLERPIYLYGTSAVPEVGDGALYHYTKFESFLNILDTMTLRSSPLSRMNDLNEVDISGLNWNSDFSLMMSAQDYIRNKCSIISFSQNYDVDSGVQEGSNHPALWAHYADNANGVCIVIDKDAFLESNREKLNNKFHRLENVQYTQLHFPDDTVVDRQYSSVSELVQLNYKELFFKKHPDWSNEGEVRFLIESNEEYLNIKGTIKHIVLGKRLLSNTKNMNRLISHIISPINLSYKYITPRTFASISNSQGGYITEEAFAVIEQHASNMLLDGKRTQKLLNDFIQSE